jgi:hypothetical protein
VSDDNVVMLPVITRLDLPPERILNGAIKRGMKEVIVIGYDSDGEEYFASSIADGADCVWHLERAKLKLLRMPEEMK